MELDAVSPGEIIGCGVVLIAAVVAGTVAHELVHAAALRSFAVPCDVEWLPARADVGPVRASITGEWARVVPRELPRDLSPWTLRVAALAPLLLAMPLALVALGPFPDPVGTRNPYAVAAIVGWLACAIPSPQDFSLFWHAERAIARGAADDH